MDMIIKIDPSYANYVTYIREKRILYAKFNKVVYGTLLEEILFHIIIVLQSSAKAMVEELIYEVK